MQLTKRGEYGLRVMLELASQPNDQPVCSREIAAKQKIPPKFIPQVIMDLSRAGLVQSVRGQQGGVKLAAIAKKINLRLIVEAVEGPIALNSCLLKGVGCELKKGCPIHPVWVRAQKQMLDVLECTTLDDLTRRISAN